LLERPRIQLTRSPVCRRTGAFFAVTETVSDSISTVVAVERCELCQRVEPLTFHHLIPRSMHRKPRFQKRYDKREMRSRGMNICRLCHNGIHDLIPEKELGDKYSTKELLLAHPGLARHVAWVRKQK
jgi:hypothetical protein